MPIEACELRGRGGRATTGTAELVRFGAPYRWARSAGVVGVGILAGLMLTPVPGLHLVAPWLLPTLALAMAAYLVGDDQRLDAVSGPCPACGAPIAATKLGYVRGGEVWLACDACRGPVVVVVR